MRTTVGQAAHLIPQLLCYLLPLLALLLQQPLKLLPDGLCCSQGCPQLLLLKLPLLLQVSQSASHSLHKSNNLHKLPAA